MQATILDHPPVKAKLFEHQLDGWRKAVNELLYGCGGYGLLYEMGCGKTLTAIAIAGTLFQTGELKRLLVIAPSSVCSVWPREFKQFADFPVQCMVLTGSSEKRRQQLHEFSAGHPDALQVAVINYEGAWRLPNAKEKTNVMREFNPGMVLCDESHRIKKHTARQSKYIHSLGEEADFRMILTGTPVQNNPLDFFSQYKFLDWSIFGKSFLQFRARYATMGGYSINGKPVQVVGYKNLDELTQKVYSCASRVTKAECLDLPPQTFETRYVDMSPAGAKLYKEMKRESIVWLGENAATAPNVLSRLLILQRLTGGFIRADDEQTARQVDTSKLDALEDIVLDLQEAGEKCVVFVRFLDELYAIVDMLNRHKIRHSAIYGAVAQTERGELVESFQTDPDVRVFVAQVDTAGLGITLTAAKVAIFYSPTWNYASYQQALARTHRIGAQHDECHYIHLIVPGTVDEDVMDALANKKNLADAVVDGKVELLKEVHPDE